MKNLKCLLVILILPLSFIACKQSNIEKDRTEINLLRDKINQELIEISQHNKKIDEKVEGLFIQWDKYKEIFAKEGDNPKYQIYKEDYYYKSQDDGKCVIFSPGIVKIDDNLKTKIRLLEDVQDDIIALTENHKLVVQSWFLGWETLTILYPFFDSVSLIPIKSDFREFNFWYDADNFHNKEKKVVWNEYPYLDPGAQGFLISALSPVYYDGKHIGNIGADVNIPNMSKRFIANNDKALLMIKNDILIAINKKCGDILNLEGLKQHHYLEAVVLETFVSDDYNLAKNKSEEIAELSHLLTNQEQFQHTINGKKYTIISTKINEIATYLVGIIE